MPTPLLIDTDMGIDDAVALGLALASERLHVAGLVSVGGNVPLDQATDNLGRLLSAMRDRPWPPVGKGLDQSASLPGASHVFGADGLGEIHLPVPPGFTCADFPDLYERLIAAHETTLTIVAVGPLTNLARLLETGPELLQRAGRIVIMGGAVWCPGNITPYAEFNFFRDPEAASVLLGSGLPITLVPLDVTRQVAVDESHMARLSRSGRRIAEVLARMIRYPLERGHEAEQGRFLVHDALAVGLLIWPEFFIQARMGLQVTTSGPRAGQCRPVVTKDKARQVSVVISVNVADFLENLIESLCRDRFVV